MTVLRHRRCLRFLTLVLAIPWPASAHGFGATELSQPAGTAQAVVYATGSADVAIALPNDRKSSMKGERFGLESATPTAFAPALPATPHWPPVPSGEACHCACRKHSTCALLCRFQV